MGRSVSHPSGAIVAFRHLDDETQDCWACDGTGHNGGSDEEGEATSCETCHGSGQLENEIDWAEEVDYYRGWIKEIFPSMTACDKWLDREDHAIAENAFAWFGLSEYCGLVAIWLAPKKWSDDISYTLEGPRDRWLAQVEPRFLKTFGQLRKLGTFSNGEGVFERV